VTLSMASEAYFVTSFNNDFCCSAYLFTKSSFIIQSHVDPATRNPIAKQVTVKIRIEIAGQKSVDSFKVKKNEATESPIKPTASMSPRMAPMTLPFAPELKYPIPYTTLAMQLIKPRIAAMMGKEAPLIKIVTIKVGNCSKKLW